MKNCAIGRANHRRKRIKTCNKSVGINFTKSVVYASGLMERGLIFEPSQMKSRTKPDIANRGNKQFWFRSNKSFHLTFKFENKLLEVIFNIFLPSLQQQLSKLRNNLKFKLKSYTRTKHDASLWINYVIYESKPIYLLDLPMMMMMMSIPKFIYVFS